MTISKITNKFLDRVNSLLDVKNANNRKTITLLAIAVFAAGLLFSAQRLRQDISWNFSASLLASMLALLIATFLINSLRTHSHSRIVGANLSFGDNARISLFGSAMNMLPLLIPAGMLMRMSNFVQHGGQSRLVIGVLLANYVLSLLSSLLLGLVMLNSDALFAMPRLLAFVGVLYVISLITFVRVSGSKYGVGIAVLEMAAVCVDAVRIAICFKLLGFNIEIFQAAILTVSAILGSAVSIVPAGLGVRELVGAVISPLIGLLPEQTFLAIALNRVFGMLFFVGLSGLVLVSDRNEAP